MRNAAQNGHVKVLRWAREHHCSWDEWTCASAAMHGELKALRWARAHGCPWDDALIHAHAETGGDQEVLRWLAENGVP